MASLRKRGRVWYFTIHPTQDGRKHEAQGLHRQASDRGTGPRRRNPRPPRSRPAWLTRGSSPGSSIPATPWTIISRSTGQA